MAGIADYNSLEILLFYFFPCTIIGGVLLWISAILGFKLICLLKKKGWVKKDET